MNAIEKKYDTINPSHYVGHGGMKSIEVLEGYGLTSHLFTAFKYILRAGKKPGVCCLEDLQKAQWFIDRALSTPGYWRTLRVVELAPCQYVPDDVPVAAEVGRAFDLSRTMTDGLCSVLGMIVIHGDVSNHALQHLKKCIEREMRDVSGRLAGAA